jgi:hypothetical protein
MWETELYGNKQNKNVVKPIGSEEAWYTKQAEYWDV